MTELRCPLCGNTTRFSVGQWVLLDRYGQLYLREGETYRYEKAPDLNDLDELAEPGDSLAGFELGDEPIMSTPVTLVMCTECNDPATGIGTVVYHDSRTPEIVLTAREGK